MTAKLLTVILAFLFAVRPSADGATEFEYGPRPPFSVFDPTGVLKPEQMREISDPLATYFKNGGIDVIVVVLTDLGDAPPEHVAGRFAAAWCTSPIHCVVLHVPGRGDGPWIVPSGKLIDHLNPDEVSHAVSDARRHASSESKDSDKIKTAATEAADMLRYWMATSINKSEMIRTETTKMRLELETKSRQWKIAAMTVAASVIPLLVGISLLAMFLRKRGPGYFPSHTWQVRLGAPHAGGNRAVTELGSPRP